MVASSEFENISIEIIDAEGPVALVSVQSPVGEGRILGALRFEAKTLYVDDAHVEGFAPGVLGRHGINAVLRRFWSKQMSSESSFKERVERRAGTTGKSQVPSFSPVELRIGLADELRSPVTLALLLRDHGLGLSRAHAVVTELADKRTVAVTVRPPDLDGLLERLREFRLVVDVHPHARAG